MINKNKKNSLDLKLLVDIEEIISTKSKEINIPPPRTIPNRK